MSNTQKFVWTVLFGGLYLIAGVRCCNWITAQLSSLNGNLAVQLLLTPVIALGLAAPGSYLVFKIWKEG